MSSLVLKLFNMSISASWVVLAVVVFRLVLKNAPKSVRVLLWGLVALRLIFPFSLKSPTSVLPSAEVIPVQQVSDRSFRVNTGFEAVDAPVNKYISVNRTQSLAEPEAKGFDLSYIWLVGIAALALYGIFSYLRLRKKVSPSKRLDAGVYSCDYIDSPFILGVVRPKIYLPSNLNDAETQYVLSHEKAHIKRLDFVWKPLGYVLLCVYWFNPVMWLGYVLLCRDIELACDERVIRDMEAEDIRAYSQTLLNLSVPRKMILSCPVAFGEVGVKERIKSILSYKKPAFWVILIAIIAVIAVTVCFLTDPEHGGDSYFQYIDDVNSPELGRTRQFKASFDSNINYVTFTVEVWQDGELVSIRNVTHDADMEGFDVSLDYDWEKDLGVTNGIGVNICTSDGEEIYAGDFKIYNGWKYNVWHDVALFVWEVETYGELITDQTIQQLYNISDGDEYVLTAAIFGDDTSGDGWYSCNSLYVLNPEKGSAEVGTILTVRAAFTADPPPEKASRDEVIEYIEANDWETTEELIQYIQSVGVDAMDKVYSRQMEQIEYENAQREAGRTISAFVHFLNYIPKKNDKINVCLPDGTTSIGTVTISNFSGYEDAPIATVPLEDVGFSLELYHFNMTLSVAVNGDILSYGKYKDSVYYPEVYADGYDILVLRSPDGFCKLLCIEPTADTTLYESEDNYEEGIYNWYTANIG